MGKSSFENKQNPLNTRVAVITGASSGIGEATARALAAEGFELLLCSRNQHRLQQTAQNIKDSGGTVYTATCDVSLESEVMTLAAFAREKWGHIDLLFNNAGSGKIQGLANTTLEVWNQTIGSSLTGTFLCCRELLPLLKAAPAPLIINNASVAAVRGFPDFSAYSAAKGGVAAFSRSIREELRPAGIRVSTLYMGAIATPFWQGQAGEWDTAQMVPCDDIGKLIAQLVTLNPSAVMEEIHLMPAAGAL